MNSGHYGEWPVVGMTCSIHTFQLHSSIVRNAYGEALFSTATAVK